LNFLWEAPDAIATTNLNLHLKVKIVLQIFGAMFHFTHKRCQFCGISHWSSRMRRSIPEPAGVTQQAQFSAGESLLSTFYSSFIHYFHHPVCFYPVRCGVSALLYTPFCVSVRLKGSQRNL